MIFIVTIFFLLFAFPAYADDVDTIISVVGPLLSVLGVPGMIATGVLTLITALRAGAATVSKNVPDAKLGRAAKAINWIGGNTKHAANLSVLLLAVFLTACTTDGRVKFEEQSGEICLQLQQHGALVTMGQAIIPNDETSFAVGFTYRQAVNFCNERGIFLEEVGGVVVPEPAPAPEPEPEPEPAPEPTE